METSMFLVFHVPRCCCLVLRWYVLSWPSKYRLCVCACWHLVRYVSCLSFPPTLPVPPRKSRCGQKRILRLHAKYSFCWRGAVQHSGAYMENQHGCCEACVTFLLCYDDSSWYLFFAKFVCALCTQTSSYTHESCFVSCNDEFDIKTQCRQTLSYYGLLARSTSSICFLLQTYYVYIGIYIYIHPF